MGKKHRKHDMTEKTEKQPAGDPAIEPEPVILNPKAVVTTEKNVYAARVFSGQSPDLPLGERVARVKAALRNQGYTDLDEIQLPTNQDYKRYL